ncbi:MAG: anthranilate synthase component I family protein [Bacteroidetes bacterium]|nr:anthranilate synthase component I family protein [Bacteroidota bacterium]
MLNWANQFNIFCLLDNQQYHFSDPAFECLLAVGSQKNISCTAGNAFQLLQQFVEENPGWLFGHLGYDLKNELEKLPSSHSDKIGFEDLHFFVPETVIKLTPNTVTVYAVFDANTVYKAITAQATEITSGEQHISIQSKLSREQYLSIIRQLQDHIIRGDCYELNFCQEFYADDANINPLSVYQKLLAISPAPFAALYKLNNRFCISASPERYLKMAGRKIISQPMKGTAKRNTTDAELDRKNKIYLTNSEKEKSENVMVVDLVRNDLSKVCKQGTVKVDELFGVYSFPQVHQMISTVSGELKEEASWVDAVKATFPMGSMTGAPKKRVMELIERYEQTKRGLFSGAIGYVDPEGNCDFNVVIRSIFYNETIRYLSFQAGSGITFYSNPEDEYEECLAKAAAIKKVLG